MTLKKNVLRKISGISALAMVAYGGFLNFEPVIANGAVDSDVINVTQDVDTEISIDSPSDVSMAGTIGGTTGGTGTGTAVWIVRTSNTAGFSMAIKASTNPALRSGGNSFADYTEAGAVPDYAWSVATTDSEFGFTVNAETTADMVAGFKDTGAGVCGSGGANTTATSCWDGLTTTDATIISRATPTDAGGEAESVTFQAESGTGHIQPGGTYTATITVTANTL